MAEQLIYYSFASLIILNSIMVVTRKNPISSAVFLIATLFLMAGVYAFLGADFVAAIQVLVYAGAIMVLFLFVIMVLNLDPEQLTGPRLSVGEIFILLVSIAGFAAMALLMFQGKAASEGGPFTIDAINESGGNTLVVGLRLFQEYVWPFEIASLMILLAIVASVVIAKKDKKSVTAGGER